MARLTDTQLAAQEIAALRDVDPALCRRWVISVENDQGRSSVYVRSTPKS
jgi:hypothetical protein